MKYVLSIIVLAVLIYIAYASIAEGNQTLLDQTTEYNTNIYEKCFHIRWSNNNDMSWSIQGSADSKQNSIWVRTDSERYRTSTDCWKSQRKLTPSDLYITVPKYLVDEGKCSISQTEDQHVRPERGWMYATDLACNFKEQGVYAPDFLDDMVEYTIEEIWTDNLMGNFIILSWTTNKWEPPARWYFGHTLLDTRYKVWDRITTWTRFAKADLSGATTGYHTHIELRRNIDGVWQSVRYVTRSKERKLDEKRLSNSSSGQSFDPYNKNTYYFTSYDLWDKSQNDDSPCTSADGKDSCQLHASGRGTMALTVDIRNKLWIKFWDKAVLTWDVGCEWVYTVTDEMACRFRGENAWSNGPCYYSDKVTLTPKVSHINRPWTPYYIKWDLPGKAGGTCSISKL